MSFGYDPDKLLMQDISFQAEPGQKIAVVGSTGAGKTTLINLLMRFYRLRESGCHPGGSYSGGKSGQGGLFYPHHAQRL